jgi:ABC-2 type transport system permease protein
MFSAGLYLPQQEMSEGLRSFTHLSPLGATVQGLQAAMQGTGFAVEAVLALVVWAAVFSYLAIRFFRWS